MAKITSNQYVKVAWVLESQMTTAQAAAPSADILNSAAAVQLNPALAWQDFALGATSSDDTDDRGIDDPGNAVGRGFANFEATLSFFRDANDEDQTSDYVKAFETFRTPRTRGYLVMRVAEKRSTAPWAPGDRVSVFRFIADAIRDETEGDDSVKFTVSYLPQGILHPYTQVSGPGLALDVTETVSVAVGEFDVLDVTLGAFDARAVSRFSSSNPSVATVTPNGVVKGLSAGSAVITTTNPASTSPATTEVTVA